jgi:hypothetical protein
VHQLPLVIVRGFIQLAADLIGYRAVLGVPLERTVSIQRSWHPMIRFPGQRAHRSRHWRRRQRSVWEDGRYFHTPPCQEDLCDDSISYLRLLSSALR